MRTKNWLAGSALILALGGGVAAQQGGLVPPSPTLTFSEVWRPSTVTGLTQVIGIVIDIRQVPVANAKVQLRNLNTGQVEQQADANEKGEYQFAVVEPGTYVVEMVLIGGYVVALSNAGSVARYETLQTVVRLPGRWDILANNVVMMQKMTDFVGMSSATTMTAATLTLAVDQNIAPVDAGEPVSP
jgi:hypothetical protein